MATRYVQQNKIRYQLIVAAADWPGGSRDFGVFDKGEGLELDGEDVKYGEFDVAVGVGSRGDCTLRRRYSETSPEEEAWLESHQGHPVTIVKSYAADDGLPVGRPRTFTGAIKGVTGPDGDVTASERSELAVVCIMNVPAS
jgi:hypothetical protein